MGHERLMHVKNCIMSAVESQVCNLQEVDAKELGEAIDMIKDLEEAIYYCTITEAMNSKEKKDSSWKENDEGEKYRRMYSMPIYEREYRPEDSSSYMMYNRGTNSSNGNSSNNSSSYARDYREGRSPQSRRMYMEAKEQHHDKAIHLRELEKYMQELSQDIVDMIQDASPDEKQYLEKKIQALASKIGQMK
jgi:hypothetical protein